MGVSVRSASMRRFGVLRDRVIDTVQALLRRTLTPTYTYGRSPRDVMRAKWCGVDWGMFAYVRRLVSA